MTTNNKKKLSTESEQMKTIRHVTCVPKMLKFFNFLQIVTFWGVRGAVLKYKTTTKYYLTINEIWIFPSANY